MIDDALSRRTIVAAGLTGAVGILLGALGAHYLADLLVDLGRSEDVIPRRLDQFDTGVRYHLIHSVALIGLASLPFGPPESRQWVARWFLAGIILFSGSLYVLVLSDVTMLGMVTPVGGVCWIIGWLKLISVARRSSGT